MKIVKGFLYGTTSIILLLTLYNYVLLLSGKFIIIPMSDIVVSMFLVFAFESDSAITMISCLILSTTMLLFYVLVIVAFFKKYMKIIFAFAIILTGETLYLIYTVVWHFLMNYSMNYSSTLIVNLFLNIFLVVLMMFFIKKRKNQ